MVVVVFPCYSAVLDGPCLYQKVYNGEVIESEYGLGLLMLMCWLLLWYVLRITQQQQSIIIRSHCSTTHVDAGSIVTERVAWSVDRSLCHTSEPCKNGWTNRDAVWVKDSGGSREPCIRWGSRSPIGRSNFEWGRASHCGVSRHSAVICANTAEPMEILFGLWAQMGPRNYVLDGGPDPPCVGAILGERGAHCTV